MVNLFKMTTGSAVDNINMVKLENVEIHLGTREEGGQSAPSGEPASTLQELKPQSPFGRINKDKPDMDKKIHETIKETT